MYFVFCFILKCFISLEMKFLTTCRTSNLIKCMVNGRPNQSCQMMFEFAIKHCSESLFALCLLTQLLFLLFLKFSSMNHSCDVIKDILAFNKD